MTELTKLRNLGPKSAQMLADSGIVTLGQLKVMGSVAAYVCIKRVYPSANLNLLWALEGALMNIHWTRVSQQERLSLLSALESYQSKPPIEIHPK